MIKKWNDGNPEGFVKPHVGMQIMYVPRHIKCKYEQGEWMGLSEFGFVVGCDPKVGVHCKFFNGDGSLRTANGELCFFPFVFAYDSRPQSEVEEHCE